MRARSAISDQRPTCRRHRCDRLHDRWVELRARVAFRLSVEGDDGVWRLDDFYVDPLKTW